MFLPRGSLREPFPPSLDVLLLACFCDLVEFFREWAKCRNTTEDICRNYRTWITSGVWSG
ncbi:hypothetical protein SS05631_c05690 [Sinorhizobium sp. CCBAU 05631]|nr:hypothetical protein SS05631_c05690 [Sinorhizobium sp. CCBAU 05631]